MTTQINRAELPHEALERLGYNQAFPLKKFTVRLTYMSLRTPEKVMLEAADDFHVRRIVAEQYPNAKLEGPCAIMEVK